jgi:hypothetical protein
MEPTRLRPDFGEVSAKKRRIKALKRQLKNSAFCLSEKPLDFASARRQGFTIRSLGLWLTLPCDGSADTY